MNTLQHLMRRVNVFSMRSFWLAPFLVTALLANSPMVLTGIERTGMPPYEGEESKIYVLTGEECNTLQEGSLMELRRRGSGLHVGKLVITQVGNNHAIGKLVERGKTFPLKGDEAVLISKSQSPTVDLPIVQPPPSEIISGATPAPKRKGLSHTSPASASPAPVPSVAPANPVYLPRRPKQKTLPHTLNTRTSPTSVPLETPAKP